MDLILWRHAEAEDPADGSEDLERALTPRGLRQAARMAAWLDRQLPDGLRVLSSPAVRAQQTAQALERKFKLRDELAPVATTDDLLTVVQWPRGRGTVLVVGHQPALGQAAARLLGMAEPDCSIRKGAVWWLRQRERQGAGESVLLAVQSPDVL